jgi:hypothetical protein
MDGDRKKPGRAGIRALGRDRRALAFASGGCVGLISSLARLDKHPAH